MIVMSINRKCQCDTFRYIYAYTFGRHASMNWTSLSCFMFEFFLETTPQMFHTATIWLTLALAILRYIYVCHPSLAKLYCTLPIAAKIVKIVVSLAVIQTVSRALDREYLVFSVGEFLIYLVISNIHNVQSILQHQKGSSTLSVMFVSWNGLTI
jgi:hypothetical protein